MRAPAGSGDRHRRQAEPSALPPQHRAAAGDCGAAAAATGGGLPPPNEAEPRHGDSPRQRDRLSGRVVPPLCRRQPQPMGDGGGAACVRRQPPTSRVAMWRSTADVLAATAGGRRQNKRGGGMASHPRMRRAMRGHDPPTLGVRGGAPPRTAGEVRARADVRRQREGARGRGFAPPHCWRGTMPAPPHGGGGRRSRPSLLFSRFSRSANACFCLQVLWYLL